MNITVKKFGVKGQMVETDLFKTEMRLLPPKTQKLIRNAANASVAPLIHAIKSKNLKYRSHSTTSLGAVAQAMPAITSNESAGYRNALNDWVGERMTQHDLRKGIDWAMDYIDSKDAVKPVD